MKTVWRRFFLIGSLCGSPSFVLAVPLQLAAGGTHSVALAADGTVYQWGEWGGLTPVPVFGLENVTAIAAGERHALALRSDGTVWAWGDNSRGQLGDGSVITRDRPRQVQGLAGIRAIACGTYNSYALRQDGTVSSWGDNGTGELGDRTVIDRRSPIPMENLSDITAIAAGSSVFLALRRDGTVCSWGAKETEDISITGSFNGRNAGGATAPLCLSDFSGIRAIAAGASAGYALREDGTVWSWGTGPCAAPGSFRSVATRMPILDRVEKISANTFQVLMLRNDETVWTCSGNNSFQTRTVDDIRELKQIDAIAAGSRHALAHSRSGLLWSWGDNTHGQLGVGDRNPRTALGNVWDGTGELTRP